jgi:hypothetical protein
VNIVVDLGCFAHTLPSGTEESIPVLAERFRPDVLYGFDPWPDQAPCSYMVGTTRVIVRPLAAWTDHIDLDYDPRNVGSTVMREKNLWGEWRGEPIQVPAFHFAKWLRGGMTDVHPGHDWIVKMDIEGAEFPVLADLCAYDLDERIALLIVEWHDSVMEAEFRAQRHVLERTLRCPVEPWPAV